jgi:hypothetical protein
MESFDDSQIAHPGYEPKRSFVVTNHRRMILPLQAGEGESFERKRSIGSWKTVSPDWAQRLALSIPLAIDLCVVYQKRRWFNPAFRFSRARVAELADALDSGSSE